MSTAPVTSVPMRLPCTTFPVLRSIKISLKSLPEMTLRAPAVVPPISVLGAPLINTPASLLPASLLGRATVPVESVSIKFPCNRFPAASLPKIRTPELWPEMTLRAPGVVPPIRLLGET